MLINTMMLICFSILYVFALFKSYSEPIIKDGEIVAITCSTNYWEMPLSRITDDKIFSNWRENYIYPVKVCATVKGGKVGWCDPIIESKLELIISWADKELIAPIDPDDFIDSNTYCHVFKASDIASVLTYWDNAELFPQAVFYGLPESGKRPTVQVSANVAPYYFNEPGSIVAAGGTNMLHAVVCDFPDCTVTVEGRHKIKATEYFRKKKGHIPKFEGTGGPVTDKTFSVTSVECEGSRCPIRFVSKKTLSMPQVVLPKVQEPLPTPQEGLETLLKAPATKTDATHMAAGAAQTMIKSSDAMPEGLHDFDRKIGTVIVNSEILVWRSGKTNGLQIFD